MKTSVCFVSNHPTVTFAAAELSRYIGLMDNGQSDVPQADIKIGLFSDVLQGRAGLSNSFDDEIYIDVTGGTGIVAGINPRSCLIAVYRLLREAGCRFLRPGADGELIPEVDWSKVSTHVDEQPSYRHRGICIEGAVAREIFLDIIDWLPKNGLNAYFIQFREGFTFFDRWYSHLSNPTIAPEPKTVEEVRVIITEGADAIRLRGLVYHAVGHGWTCEPLGMNGLGWERVNELPPGVSQYFAELGGVRELFNGVPLNTNLCYGNPEVRDRIVGDIVAYVQQHGEVDVLHFWLADGSNNHCECPLCNHTRPADFYVDMLNELDERLIRLNINTKIVFLIYMDLLWCAERSALNNPDRFILMFAPITRTYSKAFVPERTLPEPPPYIRNKLDYPKSVEGNLSHLQSWQRAFCSDSFDFDYHMMWDHYMDPGYEEFAKVLHQDIVNLSAIRLNGLISCQVQRVFFPSPLPMAVLAHTLWNRNACYEPLANDVYLSAYGQDGVEVRKYLQKLTRLFRPQWLRQEMPIVNPEQAQRLREVVTLIEGFRPTIQAHHKDSERCQMESWRLLELHSDYCIRLSGFCLKLAEGDRDRAGEALEMLKDWVFTNEMNIVQAFDCEIFSNVVGSLL